MAAFLITIDTEGDNIWSNPRETTTDNAKFLPRFQSLCEKYGLKPTYLTNYEMAMSDAFVELARDAVRRGAAEVGLHIHAWNSPPIGQEESRPGMPYLVEFPERVMAEKVATMTRILEERFACPMVSHRAGRWAFNETYARLLIDHGYTVDCSVTPHVSWEHDKGFADGQGGTDFRRFPSEAYFIDPSAVDRPGRSALLEVPMTIVPDRSSVGGIARAASDPLPRLVRKAVSSFFPPAHWFRPNGRNLSQMRKLLKQRRGSDYIEFMLHSSELMPGGSPAFRTERSIEILYDHVEQLFDEARPDYRGATLGEFRAAFQENDAEQGTPASPVGDRRSA